MKNFKLLLVAFVALAASCAPAKQEVTLLPQSNFDTIVDGKAISLYTLKNDKGMTAQITNYGARVVTLWVADKAGKMVDVVAGYETIREYLTTTELYYGAIVGRYGNRIAKGQFTLDSVQYQLPLNNGENHLHGGPKGICNQIWTAEQAKNEQGEDILKLTYVSPDGEEGYPGDVTMIVTYTLTNNNELKVGYEATTDKATVLNLTHHSFFNLGGVDKMASINTHEMKINSDFFTPTDAGLIPTGELATVEGTPMDFRTATAIGARVGEEFEPLVLAGGYDHNWVLNKQGNELSSAAEVYEPSTGIAMEVLTTEPAIQFYGGNFMKAEDKGKYGVANDYRTALCLETQHYPDSPNHPEFPSTVLRPGETYTQTCTYAFSVR